jgi:hypothetical protein
VGRIVKGLFWITLLCGLLAFGSYAGARLAAGRLVGTGKPLAGRETQFAFKGVERLPGRPRAWVFTYSISQLPGVARATIYVSPTGAILAMQPADLDARIDAWERAREP